MNSPKRWILSLVFTVLRFKKSLLILLTLTLKLLYYGGNPLENAVHKQNFNAKKSNHQPAVNSVLLRLELRGLFSEIKW